jgi:hypothetical protein
VWGLGCPKLPKYRLPIGRGGAKIILAIFFKNKSKNVILGQKPGPKRAKTTL